MEIEEHKEPLFKEGQFVKIKKREGAEKDYKYFFTDAMTAFEGDVCVISEVVPNGNPDKCIREDDNAVYHLKGQSKGANSPSRYDWASSMLEAVESPKPSYKVGQKVRIKKRVKDMYGAVWYTDDMSKHRGEVDIIVGIRANPGAYGNGDDFHVYKLQKLGYSWTKSMLEPIEEILSLDAITTLIEEEEKMLEQELKERNWPMDAKFQYNQKVQISSVITSDSQGFTKDMIDYVGNEGRIKTIGRQSNGVWCYQLDNENGGDIWWPESLLTEIN